MSGDSVKNVLITRAEDNVRVHAVRSMGHAPGDELGVLLAAAFRLPVSAVPLAVEPPGRPVWIEDRFDVPGRRADGNRLARQLGHR